MQSEMMKEGKSTELLLREAMLECILNIHKVHLERPFGSGLSELDFLQYRILASIAAEPTTIKDISQTYNISRRNVESNILYLLKLELIDKKTKKAGGRGSLISITEHGEEVLSAVKKQIDQIFAFTMNKYSIKQERTIINFLEELSEGLSKVGREE